MNNDSIELLKKCNSGCKSGTNSMEQVMDFVSDERLRKVIHEYNRKHIDIGDECHEMLNKENLEEEDPPMIAKAMSWLGTEVKLAVNDSTSHIADILIDGCNMGIKSLYKELNKQKNAKSEIRDMVMELVCIEQDFMNELLEFL